MKRKISVLLAVCMVLTLSIGLFVPAGAASVDGAGEIVRNDKGVIYSFAGIQKTTGAVGYYNYYQTGDGIVFADYNGGNYPAEISNDADGNLCAKINEAGRLELTFVSGFAYPNTNNYGAFYDINAIAIRYRVIGLTEDGNTTFTGTGNDLSSNCSLTLRADGSWVETVCELTPSAEGRPFGNWKVNGDGDGLNSYNKLHFGGLTAGTTLVIDYIGLFNSAVDARAEMVSRNSIQGAENKSYTAGDGQVFRFTNVSYTGSNNAWNADDGVVMYAPADGRALSNDADGNLVMVTKSGSHWDPICFYGMTYGSAYVAEMRYKTTDAAGNALTPPAFTDANFKVTGTAAKTLETTQDQNGWYVTRAIFDAPVQPQSGTGLTSLSFPSDDTSVVYTIDYVGFFGNEAAADANTKRARVFTNDAVKLYGGQAKTDGNALRLVGIIDDYTFASYEEFGFKVSYNGKVATGKVEKYVYDSLMAGGDEISIPENAVTGQGEGTKFFTWCINEIPESEFAGGKITFLVCAYAKIGGAEICGSSYRVVYDKVAQTVTATQVSA